MHILRRFQSSVAHLCELHVMPIDAYSEPPWIIIHSYWLHENAHGKCQETGLKKKQISHSEIEVVVRKVETRKKKMFSEHGVRYKSQKGVKVAACGCMQWMLLAQK